MAKVELKNAKISLDVDGVYCTLKVEKAIICMEENGEVYCFEAQFMRGTAIEEILWLGNMTRLRVCFNGLRDRASFVYSEAGQKIKVAEVRFLKIP